MKSMLLEKLRILAVDLDDTLLRSDLSISPRMRGVIRRTEEIGLTLVLTSGRIPEAMERYVRLLRLHKRPGYLISNNGSLITESQTGNIIHEVLVDQETLMAICDLADSEGFPMQMYADKITYISRKNKYTDIDEQLTGLRQVVVENFRDLAGFGCHKLIIPGEPEHPASVEEIIRSSLGEKISVFTSRKYFLQISPGETNKGTALAKIAGAMGLGADATIAVGDSMNDEPMIRWAGIGVVMANGDERLKSVADFVTSKTNDEDGLIEVIEKYFPVKV